MPRSASTVRPACSSRARVSALRRWRTIPMRINDTDENRSSQTSTRNDSLDTHGYLFSPQNAFLIASRDSTPKDWAPAPAPARPPPVPRRQTVTDPAARAPGDQSLQFDHVERAGQTPGLTCSICQRPIAASYYEINGKVTCQGCRGQIMAAWNRGSSSQPFAKALGLGAAAPAPGAGVNPAAPPGRARPRLLAVLFGVAFLLALAYAAPVIIGFSSPLHLLIAGFALYEAWKLNRGVALRVTGPYQASRAVPG